MNKEAQEVDRISFSDEVIGEADKKIIEQASNRLMAHKANSMRLKHVFLKALEVEKAYIIALAAAKSSDDVLLLLQEAPPKHISVTV